MVQNLGQQGRSPLALLFLLLSGAAFHIGGRRSAADVVIVPVRRRERRTWVLVWEWERVGWSGPAALLSVVTLPTVMAAEAGLLLRVLPTVPSLQILEVVMGPLPEDLQVPVLKQQRGGADEDEQAHSHDHGPSQLHPLHVGAAPAAHRLRRRGHVTRHSDPHSHQNHGYTQHQPDARGRAQVQPGLESVALPRVSAAHREADR